MEDNSEDVKIGKALHDLKNINQNNEVSIENIKVDKITSTHVVEIKKSDADILASKYQLLFYLYILNQKGIIKKGRLEFIKKNKQDKKIIEVELNSLEKLNLENIINEINILLNKNCVPNVLHDKKCKKCSYYEYCFC